MREDIACILFLLLPAAAHAQTIPAGWRVVKDAGKVCQLAVPSEWSLYGEKGGAAVLEDASSAIATVTSQPAQDFSPLAESMLRLLEIPKDRVFENTLSRIFYQERASLNKEDPNTFSFSVPGKTGTCSGHLRALPAVQLDTVRKIALSLGPIAAANPTL